MKLSFSCCDKTSNWRCIQSKHIWFITKHSVRCVTIVMWFLLLTVNTVVINAGWSLCLYCHSHLQNKEMKRTVEVDFSFPHTHTHKHRGRRGKFLLWPRVIWCGEVIFFSVSVFVFVFSVLFLSFIQANLQILVLVSGYTCMHTSICTYIYVMVLLYG